MSICGIGFSMLQLFTLSMRERVLTKVVSAQTFFCLFVVQMGKLTVTIALQNSQVKFILCNVKHYRMLNTELRLLLQVCVRHRQGHVQ